MRLIEGLVSSGAVELVELDAWSLTWIVEFLERYAASGAQLADAAVMLLAEREGDETVFTLDRRDFLVYRTRGGLAPSIIPEI